MSNQRIIKRALRILWEAKNGDRIYTWASVYIDLYCAHIAGLAQGTYDYDPCAYDKVVRALNVARDVLPEDEYMALDMYVSDHRLIEIDYVAVNHVNV